MRILKWILGPIIGILVLGFLPMGGQFLVVPFYLVAGWIFFLKRILPQVTFHPGGIALAIVCSVIVVAGIHWFARWIFSRGEEISAEESGHQKWRWRWTFGIFLLICLLFVSSIASTGAFHQVAWLMSSDEPFFVNRHRRILLIHDLRQIALDIYMAADEQEWKSQETQTAWKNDTQFPPSRPVIENWHTLFLEDEKGKVACVIFHRDPQTRSQMNFGLVADGKNDMLPNDKLPEVLARYGIKAAPATASK